jgi:hypothetical protein
MSTLSDLAEQHVRESELRLRHVDALMAQVREAPDRARTVPEVDDLLARLSVERDSLAAELAALRRGSFQDAEESVRRGQGLQSTLERIGAQLEQALTAVLRRG